MALTLNNITTLTYNTSEIQRIEEYYQDHYAGAKVAVTVVLCMGGNDFLPAYYCITCTNFEGAYPANGK